MTGQDELVELIARTAEGDRAAFSMLYRSTCAKLNGVVRRILYSNETAEEALQEAYVRIWQSAQNYDPAIASPMTWLAAIARNQAIDIRRRSSERISADAVDSSNLVEELAAAKGLESVDALSLARLRRCLEALADERRDMILLAYNHGFSREELAQRYGKPVATVKSVLRRGLMALRDCIDGSHRRRRA